MKKYNKGVFCSIRVSVIILMAYLALDYINIATNIGIDIKQINLTAFNIILNSLIVVTLFAITYFTIDSIHSQRMKNQEEIANILLKNTYLVCSDNIALLENEEIIKHVVAKIDFNKALYDNNIPVNFRDNPFINESEIMKFASDGVISALTFKDYLNIKNLYMGYLSNAITFFDHPEVFESKKLELKRKLKCAYNNNEMDLK